MKKSTFTRTLCCKNIQLTSKPKFNTLRSSSYPKILANRLFPFVMHPECMKTKREKKKIHRIGRTYMEVPITFHPFIRHLTHFKLISIEQTHNSWPMEICIIVNASSWNNIRSLVSGKENISLNINVRETSAKKCLSTNVKRPFDLACNFCVNA